MNPWELGVGCHPPPVRYCARCFEPRPNIGGMTPWDYYHMCANLGKYEETHCTFECACAWIDSPVQA